MDTAIIFSAPDLATRDTNSAKRFWKELLYEGQFRKEHENGRTQRINVTRDDIDQFTQESNRFLSNGNKIYVPKEHTDDPEENRGYVLMTKSTYDENKERQSFWGLVEFRDEEAAKMAKSTDMSVFIPDSWTDGNGEVYDRVLVHSALTVAPVVPDLHGYEAIVASLTKPKRKKKMPRELDEIAEGLGMELDEGVTLTADMIIDHVEAQNLVDDDDDDDEFDDEFDFEEEDEIESHAPSKREKVLLSKNRRLEIDGLKLSKAQSESLKKRWCSDKAVSKAFESDDADDAFNQLVLSLKDSAPSATRKKRTVRRDRDDDDFQESVNPVLEDAKRRSKKKD